MRYNSRTLGSRAISANIGYQGYNIPDTKMGRRSGDNREKVLALVEQIKYLHQEMNRLRQADSLQASTANELAQLQESLEDAIAKVVHYVRPRISEVIRRRVSHQQDAEDILQEVLISVVEQLWNNPEAIRSFFSWVDHVAINKVCEHYRKTQRQLPADVESDLRAIESLLEDEETDSILERTPSPDPPIDTVAICRDLLSRVRKCLQAALSKDEYTVLDLRFKGHSHEEVAVLMQRKATWVRQTYKRALSKAAAAIALDPDIVTNEEIEEAIERCQRSENPEDRLTEAELSVLRDTLLAHPRKLPRWHQIDLFREACLKMLKHIQIPNISGTVDLYS